MNELDPKLAQLLAAGYHLQDATLLRLLQIRGDRQTFLVSAQDEKLVVNVTHAGRNEATVAAETDILAHLAKHSFPAPPPVAACDGRLYLPFGDRFVSIYRYLEGALPQPDDAFFTTLGHQLAKLHSL